MVMNRSRSECQCRRRHLSSSQSSTTVKQLFPYRCPCSQSAIRRLGTRRHRHRRVHCFRRFVAETGNTPAPSMATTTSTAITGWSTIFRARFIRASIHSVDADDNASNIFRGECSGTIGLCVARRHPIELKYEIRVKIESKLAVSLAFSC